MRFGRAGAPMFFTSGVRAPGCAKTDSDWAAMTIPLRLM
jgi:hypothetical protein